MVKKQQFRVSFVCLMAFLCLTCTIDAQDPYLAAVQASAQVDPYRIYENQPLHGTLSITHSTHLAIDAGSFLIEGKPLKTDLIKNVKMPSQQNVEVSIYQFELPGQPQGLYVLPEITVSVGGQQFRTIPSTYEVTGMKAAPPAAFAAAKATLNLQSFVDGPPSTYPGHVLRFGYRYIYTGDIELTAESLPLLEAAGFKKIGEKQIKDYLENGASIREVTQMVKADAPGEFVFPAGYIEGYSYTEQGSLKKRTYLSPKLRGEAPETTVVVNAFPKKGKPDSFNGAVGEFTFQTRLLTTPIVHVDDKMELAIEIAGVADLSDVAMPPLTRLKSLFRFSDLPPSGSIDNSTERYTVEIYPLSKGIKEIPPIQFSYLEPLSGTYVTLESQPIAIQVLNADEPLDNNVGGALPPLVQPQPSSPPSAQNTPEPDRLPAAPQVYQPAAVEVSSIYNLEFNDLKNKVFGTWEIFWIVPIGLILLGSQYWVVHSFKGQGSRVKAKAAFDLFEEFKGMPASDPAFYKLLSSALMLRLFERKQISAQPSAPEQLPSTGLPGEVREFLIDIEEQRFAHGAELNEADIKNKAQQLLNKLG